MRSNVRWLLLGLVVGCSEPQFADQVVADAGADACVQCAAKLADTGLPMEDARVPPDARVEPAAALLGKYAVHTRFYGREQTLGAVDLLHELITIADITREPSGLKMRVETCQDSGHLLTLGLRTNVRVKYPQYFPIRTFDLIVEGNSFHTAGEPLPVGYTKQWPSACTAGARIPSSAGWTKGTCECVAGDAPPSRADDCRVIDSDQDGNPGMTVEASGAAPQQSVRVLDHSQYVFGVIDEASRKHRANFDKDEELQELCLSGNCMSYAGRFCAISTQLVTFVPLTETAIDCSEVLQRVDTNLLFSGEGLDGSFPGGC